MHLGTEINNFTFYLNLIVNWALFTFKDFTMFLPVFAVTQAEESIDSKEILLAIMLICILKTGFS